MKKRTLLGVVCVALACCIAFVVTPLLSKMTAQAGKIDIVRMAKDIPQGQLITAEDFVVVTVGKEGLPADVVRSAQQAAGKFAACDIKANDFLLPSKLSDSADSAEAVFRRLDGTKQAMSITIGSFAAGLSGKLQNGDIVSILVPGQGTEKAAAIPAELKYVRVITTTTADGFDQDAVTPAEDGTKELPSTITLLVSPAQAKLLAQYENGAKLQVALVYRGTPEQAEQFLKLQDEVLP